LVCVNYNLLIFFTSVLFTFLFAPAGRVAGIIADDEWNYFLRGSPTVIKDFGPNPAAEWLRPTAWPQVVGLESIQCFSGLVDTLKNPQYVLSVFFNVFLSSFGPRFVLSCCFFFFRFRLLLFFFFMMV
jgi:hypothetical protein